ncbi:MAG: hypothetical protein ABSH56_07690 [Bryobacteraceae bacterium]
MSRNSLILERATLKRTTPGLTETVTHTGEYLGLIRQLFRGPSVVALVESGTGTRSAEACRGIAAELAASGNRVVIVQVRALLAMSEIPEVAAYQPGRVANVSLWPSTVGAPIEFFQSPASVPSHGDWVGFLRRDFDSVLLDCPCVETAPSAGAIAAQADAAVLVVEAGKTSRRQIQGDQEALRLRGVKLAGCILMRKR